MMFDDCIADMMEPYGGNTPLFSADKTDATVTIVQEAYDDGMKVTRIQTPPRMQTSSLMEAIDTILGIMDYTCPSLDKVGQDSDKASDKSEGGDKSDKVQSKSDSKDKPDKSDKDRKPDKQRGFEQNDESDREED